MTRLSTAAMLFVIAIALCACSSGDDSEAPKKVAAAPVKLVAPTTTDDKQWQDYLQKVVAQNMSAVSDRVYPYYLPMNSGEPVASDPEKKSQYDRQVDNVSSVVIRTVLPGNMLAFGSPDSAKMADLVVAAFTGARADALRGSQVLFIGKSADSARVKVAAEAAGAKYIFIEAK